MEQEFYMVNFDNEHSIEQTIPQIVCCVCDVRDNVKINNLLITFG